MQVARTLVVLQLVRRHSQPLGPVANSEYRHNDGKTMLIKLKIPTTTISLFNAHVT